MKAINIKATQDILGIQYIVDIFSTIQMQKKKKKASKDGIIKK